MARVSPPELVKAVLEGVRAQMKEDRELRDVNAVDACPSPEEDEHLEDYAEDFAPSNEKGRKDKRRRCSMMTSLEFN